MTRNWREVHPWEAPFTEVPPNKDDTTFEEEIEDLFTTREDLDLDGTLDFDPKFERGYN